MRKLWLQGAPVLLALSGVQWLGNLSATAYRGKGICRMSSRVIVALDYADAQSAMALVDRLQPSACKLKVGKELFTTAGPAFVGTIVQRGFDVFLDLKFHDIPNTVAQACRAAAQLGVWMVNVHALGGRTMMSAAREAIEFAPRKLHWIAVSTAWCARPMRRRRSGIKSAAVFCA